MRSLRVREIDVPQRPDEESWEYRMRRAMREALTEKDFGDLARVLMDKAKAGDRTALQIVLGQLVNAGPKTLVVHQHFDGKKKRKANGQAQYIPGPEDVASDVAKLRNQKGLPPVQYPIGDE
jgi:hypothetical protein